MASRLKWGLGFGGGAIILFGAATYVAIQNRGWARYPASVIAAVVLLYMIRQFHRWNGPGWRKYHERAMLAYAGLWGREVSRAAAAHEQPDVARACRELWRFLVQAETRVRHRASMQQLASGDAAGALHTMVAEIRQSTPRSSPPPTIEDLETHGGELMSNALVKQGAVVEALLDRDTLAKAIRELPGAAFSPQTVIFGVVSLFQGEQEAAKYVAACVSGKAT